MHRDLRPAKISPFRRHDLGQESRPLRPLSRAVSVLDRTTRLDKLLQQPRPHLFAEPGLRIEHLNIAHTLFDNIIIGQAGIFDPSFEFSVDFGVIGGCIGDFGGRSGRGCEVELGLERRDDVATDVGACAFGFWEGACGAGAGEGVFVEEFGASLRSTFEGPAEVGDGDLLACRDRFEGADGKGEGV